MTPTIQVDQLDHIGVRVADPQTTAAWYERTLGLRRRPPHPGEPLLVDVGRAALALTAAAPTGLAHLAYRVAVAEIDAFAVQLARAGISVRRVDHRTNDSVYFADPDGVEIELIAYHDPGDPMSDPKQVVTALVGTMFNRHDLTAADALVAPDVIDHSGFPGQAPGLEGMKQRWGMLLGAFPTSPSRFTTSSPRVTMSRCAPLAAARTKATSSASRQPAVRSPSPRSTSAASSTAAWSSTGPNAATSRSCNRSAPSPDSNHHRRLVVR